MTDTPMWHEYIAYLIIAGAFLYTAYRIWQSLRKPTDSGACATCNEDCKLRGLKRPGKEEKKKNCKNSGENRYK